MWPSLDPENTTPGIAVTAADCAGLHPDGAFAAQGMPGVDHTVRPSEIANAVSPPPTAGSKTKRLVSSGSVGLLLTGSEAAAYTRRPSVAMPHCTPPVGPPSPRVLARESRPSDSDQAR